MVRVEMSDEALAASATGAFGYALAAMTGLLAANGGALLALLSLIGNICPHDEVSMACASVWKAPLASFAVGVATSIVCAMFSWLSQVQMLYAMDEDAGRKTRVAAIVSIIASLCGFASGSVLAIMRL